MPATIIDLNTARNIALNSQFPDRHLTVREIVEHLGYVQIDTISVIERAHHHTLWNRNNGYDQATLDELQRVDRAVFEYWGHAASILPMRDYRYYLPLMKRKFRKDAREWLGIDTHDKIMTEVLDRIRDEGALASKDFADHRKNGNAGWWDWKPAKRALELLFWGGELMISRRENFHRLYDLTERVLPDTVDTTLPTDEELGRFLVLTALRAHGICTEKDIFEHLFITSKTVIGKAIQDMVSDGEIKEVAIESLNEPWYVLPEALENDDLTEKPPTGCRLLSPFDNTVILRDRVLKLYGFDYKIECYVPAPKRVYGYFTTPILYDGKFMGRIDPKADRKKKTLILRNIAFEPNIEISDDFLHALSQALKDFALFNRCHHIIIEKCEPKKVCNKIQRWLEK